MQDLTQTQWREQLSSDSNAVIMDVRSEIELEDGQIPNAINLDINNPAEFMNRASTLDSSKNYYVYCRSGVRSTQACVILTSLGCNNTFNLLGGFSEWEGEITY
jgi:rhodanese-related sulfurtransferase